MGAMQRRKGAGFERWVVNALKDAGWSAKRMAPLQASQTADTPDVFAWRDVAGRTLRLNVEAKAGKRIGWDKALEQARQAAGREQGAIPVVVGKLDRQQPCVMLSLEDFLEIVG